MKCGEKYSIELCHVAGMPFSVKSAWSTHTVIMQVVECM